MSEKIVKKGLTADGVKSSLEVSSEKSHGRRVVAHLDCSNQQNTPIDDVGSEVMLSKLPLLQSETSCQIPELSDTE